MHTYAISQAKGKFDGSAQERDGKLYGMAPSRRRTEKNEIWMAIKTIPDWQNDIVADIKVTGGPAAAPAAAAAKTYTVKAGDTLSAIAKEHLGNASAYMKIFDANKDQLSRSGQDQAGAGPEDSCLGPGTIGSGAGLIRALPGTAFQEWRGFRRNGTVPIPVGVDILPALRTQVTGPAPG